MHRIHVILGSGPVARATAETLVSRGAQVRIATRSGAMQSPPAGVELFKADIRDKAAMYAAVQGADSVYQCAQPPYARWVTEFPELQRAATEAAERVGARLVLAENLYAYGDRGGAPIDDSSRLDAKDAKGRVRAMMSDEAFAAHRAGRLRVCSVRASDFFGPWAWEQSHLGVRSIGALARGKPAQALGDPDVPHAFTYIRDFGTALAELGLSGKGDGQAWLAPNAKPDRTQGEALAAFADALGVPLRVSAAGRGALRLASVFVPVVRELLPILYQFEQPYTVESSAFERTFGLQATPFDQAVAETVAWMRGRGLAPARTGASG